MNRKKSKPNLLVFLLLWLAVSVVFFFCSELLTNALFPGYSNVGLWLIVVSTGLSIIFLVFAIVILRKIFKRK